MEDLTRPNATWTPTPWVGEGDAHPEDGLADAAEDAKTFARRTEKTKHRQQLSHIIPDADSPPLRPAPPSKPTFEVPSVKRSAPSNPTVKERLQMNVVLPWNNPPSWDANRATEAERIAGEGDPATLRLFLRQQDSAVLAHLQSMRRSILHIPAASGDLSTLILLIFEFNFDIGKVWPGRGTPLHTAAAYAQHKIVTFILTFDDAKTGLNLQDPVTKQTPLHLAANTGALRVVKILLSQSVRVNMLNAKGETPLILACKRGHAEVAMFLVENFDAVLTFDVIDVSGRTAVHYALELGLVGLLKLLLQKGASLRSPNSYHSPLQVACKGRCGVGALNMVRYLVEELGETEGVDGAGESCSMFHNAPLQLAEQAGNVGLVEYLQRGREMPKGFSPDVVNVYAERLPTPRRCATVCE